MPTNRPHVLVLMCDQMQHDRMGFVNGISYTPNLDRLAAEGIHFTHAFTQHGQCVPARAVFMTGQPAHQCGVTINYGFHGRYFNMLTGRHHTLAKAFGQAGYRNVYFGKGHLGTPVETILTTLGFGEGKVYDEVRVPDDEAAVLGIDHVPPSLRSNYVAADDAERYLEQVELDGRPMFFMFSTNLPHPPFFSERRMIDRFPPERMPVPVSYEREAFAGKPAFIRAHAEDGVHGAGTPAERRLQIAQYESMIAMTDEHVGRIIEAFKTRGWWDDTLVLFLADHGDMMGAHRMSKKGTLPYEELYRIPCLLKLPAGMTSQRRTIDDLFTSDALPGTLLKLAALPVPGSFTGGDIADALTRDSHPADEAVCFEHYGAYWGIHPFRAIRTRDHKLIRYFGPDDELEYYDLARDPHELEGSPETGPPELIRELDRRLGEWWQRTEGRSFDWYESEDFRNNRHNL